MSPLVMFNHLLFVNTSPARNLSQSAPGPPRDLETENIQAPSQGLLALPQVPEELPSAAIRRLPRSPRMTLLIKRVVTPLAGDGGLGLEEAGTCSSVIHHLPSSLPHLLLPRPKAR